MRRVPRWIAAPSPWLSFAALVSVAACVAQDKAGEPKAPAMDPERSSSPAAAGGAAPPPDAPVMQAAPPGPAGTASGPDRAVAIRAAQREVESAQREVDAAGSDCAAACRALGSLERAAVHLCGLAVDPPDVRRCEDARDSVDRARSRVRASCGGCT